MINIKKMNDGKKLTLFLTLILVLSGLYLFWGLNSHNFSFFLRRRIPKLVAMYILGAGIGTATTIFQTVTLNRILTPSILGIDAMYLFFNVGMLYILGSDSVLMTNPYISFTASAAFTIFCTLIVHRWIFSRDHFGIDKIVLIGIVIGTLFKSVSTLLEVMLDPNEFSLVQDMSFASINNTKGSLIYLTVPLLTGIIIYLFRISHKLDVLGLGRDHSINLGIDYDTLVKRLLFLVAVIMSITTSLVGPMSFFGIITINLAREMIRGTGHRDLITFTSILGVAVLIFAQFLLERFFNMIMPVGVLISFIGGLYFIILLVKESQDV